MKWISDSEFVIGNKVYHCTHPEWIKNFIASNSTFVREENDNDTPKNKEAT